MKFLDKHMDDVKRKSSVNYLSNEKVKKLRSKFIHRVHSKKKAIFKCEETYLVSKYSKINFDRFSKIFVFLRV